MSYADGDIQAYGFTAEAAALASADPQFLLPVRGVAASAATSGKPSLSVVAAGAQITRANNPWGGTLGAATTVTYGYSATAQTPLPDVGGWSRFTEAQIKMTELALQSWSDLANITFQRVGAGTTGEGAYSNNASIRFGNFATGQSAQDSAGFAYLPGDRAATAQEGDVYINSSDANNTSAAGQAIGGYGVLTLVHELGHALGLDHPGEYNAGMGAPTYGASATYFEDSKQYTVMSYFDAANTGADHSDANPSAPLIDDIAAIQRLYGANMTTRTGDTTYGFNSNADRPWFAATSATQKLIFAVWDAGGSDTFDFSGYAQAQTIDLRPTGFSDVGGLKANVSIAAGVTIENAIGGSGADTITGNDADNRITGGGGNDTIDGGAGTDTAVYSGARASYTITTNTDGSFTVVDTRAGSPEGTDKLISIERIQFSDGTINPATPTLVAGTGVALAAVMRADASSPSNATLVTQLVGLQPAAAMAPILVAARQTSSVATLSYEFFTGKVPGAPGMDYLVSPTGPNPANLNASYYQAFNIENRYINFSVNLGKSGEGASAFLTKVRHDLALQHHQGRLSHHLRRHAHRSESARHPRPGAADRRPVADARAVFRDLWRRRGGGHRHQGRHGGLAADRGGQGGHRRLRQVQRRLPDRCGPERRPLRRRHRRQVQQAGFRVRRLTRAYRLGGSRVSTTTGPRVPSEAKRASPARLRNTSVRPCASVSASPSDATRQPTACESPAGGGPSKASRRAPSGSTRRSTRLTGARAVSSRHRPTKA